MNKIHGLHRVDGSVCENENEDKAEVLAFYQNLYQTQGFADASDLLSHVPVKVTQGMNDDLTKPYTAEDVKSGVISNGSIKGPWC